MTPACCRAPSRWSRRVSASRSPITGSGSIAVSPKLRLSLSLSRGASHYEQRPEFSLDDRVSGSTVDTTFSSLRVNAKWLFSGQLTIDSTLTAWLREFEYPENPVQAYDDTVVSADIRVYYLFRKFSADLRIFYNDWEIRRVVPDSDYLRTDNGVQLLVRRYF